jgi:LysM repeat protein
MSVVWSGVKQSDVNWVLQQAKRRLGFQYLYGEVYSPTDLDPSTGGGDCSGVAGWVLQALVYGPANIPVWSNGQWAHCVSTESWAPYAAPGSVGPFGTIRVAQLSDIPADAALTVNIMHHGGGEDSHMNVVVPLPGSLPYEGVIVESNGGPTTYNGPGQNGTGSCTNGTGGNSSHASLWTDHHYLPGPWIMDVPPWDGTPPPAPAPSGKTYTVQPGDDLSTIAADLNITLGQLEAANPGINVNLIFPGQVLNVP